MSQTIDGTELGAVLCEMLGIDPTNVVAIEVIARVGSPAQVLIESRPIFSDGWTMEEYFSITRREK